MRVRRILFSVLLVCLVAFTAQRALALLTSSYYDGSVYYDEPWDDGYLRGRIDFAVYDDRSEFEALTGLSAPGDGSYVYAYQIFNDLIYSDEAVAYFAILGLTEENTSGLSFGDDGSGGVEPYDAYLEDSGSKGVWEWVDDETHSLIYMGDHSWLLIFSSDQDWVSGEYEIRGPEEDEFPVPGEVPEPTVVALLGVGGAFILRRRKSNS